MREILFRGKRADGGGWVEGWYYPNQVDRAGKCAIDIAIIRDDGLDDHEVIPSTIGQFSGLHDRDGKRIFEGDRVVRDDPSSPFYMGAGEPKTIIYSTQSARFHADGTLFDNLCEYCHNPSGKNVSKVIGNIHEEVSNG